MDDGSDDGSEPEPDSTTKKPRKKQSRSGRSSREPCRRNWLLQRPTVSSLSDPEWVAINTILEEKTARDLIPRLKPNYRLLLGSNTNELHALHYRKQFAAHGRAKVATSVTFVSQAAMAETFPPFRLFDPQDMAGDIDPGEYHPGAIRYYKEVGKTDC